LTHRLRIGMIWVCRHTADCGRGTRECVRLSPRPRMRAPSGM
jgi:hypothetical protein